MKPTTKKNELIGQYFHSVSVVWLEKTDGKIEKKQELHWQGQVIGNPEPGFYLCQLYEWLAGSPNVIRLVGIEEMKDWLFYDSVELMHFSYEKGVARKGGPYRST